MTVLFLLTGIVMSIRNHFFQVVYFKHWMKATIGTCFTRKGNQEPEDGSSISQFQSLCTALAATVGVGNVSGVAVALALGGPGSIFWMWISAFFGMMTKYSEIVLGICYRERKENGNWLGGPMLYMEKGIRQPFLGVIFSCACVLSSFGMGNMAQSNEIANGLNHAFHIPRIWTAAVLTVGTGMVLHGGIQRIASVTERIVPFMAALYIIGAGFIIGIHIETVPQYIALIWKEAWNLKAAGSGTLTFGLCLAVKQGIARGIFSNEAGLGSSVMAHAAAQVDNPVHQGMWGIFEVFADTFLICTITAFAIMCSGVYDYSKYTEYIGVCLPPTLHNGLALTSQAFEAVYGKAGGQILSVIILLFASSTIWGWYYYGEQSVQYLFGLYGIRVYRNLYLLIVFAGCFISLEYIIGMSDIFNMMMALPNLTALLFLSKKVERETNAYRSSEKFSIY